MPSAQASERGWGKEMEEAEGEEREERQEGGKRGGESSRRRESSIKITEGEVIVKALCPLGSPNLPG